MTLIAFVSADDGVTPVVLESNYVETLRELPAASLPPGVLTGTRITMIAEAGNNVDVVGTLAATIALLGGGGGGVFGQDFTTSPGGVFSTNSAVLVPVPGTQITIVNPGAYFVIPTADLEVSNIAEKAVCQLLKNGAPFGQQLFRQFPAAASPQAEFCQHIVDTFLAGDLLEIGLAASPGGGPNTAQTNGPRLTSWRVG